MHALEQVNPIHILTDRVNSLEKAMHEMEKAKKELHMMMAEVMQVKLSEDKLATIKSVMVEGSTAEAVDKRYKVWGMLYDNGYSVSAISRAWNVDRKLVQYAQNNGWRSKHIVK